MFADDIAYYRIIKSLSDYVNIQDVDCISSFMSSKLLDFKIMSCNVNFKEETQLNTSTANLP